MNYMSATPASTPPSRATHFLWKFLEVYYSKFHAQLDAHNPVLICEPWFSFRPYCRPSFPLLRSPDVLADMATVMVK